MARVRSTARVERDGDETEATETVPISKAMRRSGLVSSEDTPAAEATQADVEEAGSKDANQKWIVQTAQRRAKNILQCETVGTREKCIKQTKEFRCVIFDILKLILAARFVVTFE